MDTPQVMVVGSANMDLVVRTQRFPQAGETLLGGEFATFPGGKGANQAVAIGRLGGSVRFVGCVGRDSFGDELMESLKRAGVDTALVLRQPDVNSGIAVITVDAGGQNTIVVAPGANARVHPDEVAAAVTTVSPAVLLAQLEVPVEAIAAAAKSLPKESLFILNPAPAQELPDDVLARADYLTPNETETEVLTGIFPADDAACLTAAGRLFDRGVRHVLITLSQRGSFLATPEGGRHFPTLNVRTVDSTAAGDAFNGGLAHFLAQGVEASRAVTLANVVGAISATREGAQASMPSMDDVREFAGELLG